MSAHEEELREVIISRALSFGNFTLASGTKSNYYIDGKMIEVFSEAAFLIGEVIYERTKDLNIDAIGGLEVGAVPLTTAAAIAYHRHGRRMEGFWVRDKAKGHGTRKIVEGCLKPGSRVAIVDDVLTTGGSALKAITEVKAMGCEVAVVLALVDRLQGAAQKFLENGIETYRPVFTIRDLGVSVDAREAVGSTAE